jgi:hypothetical protein
MTFITYVSPGSHWNLLWAFAPPVDARAAAIVAAAEAAANPNFLMFSSAFNPALDLDADAPAIARNFISRILSRQCGYKQYARSMSSALQQNPLNEINFVRSL